jgi:hypothetical protein
MSCVGTSQDRIAAPVNPTEAAREKEHELDESSEVRPVVSRCKVPWLIITLDRLRELPLDTRAGYLVSMIDGRSTIEYIATISGIPVGEVTAIFAKLLTLGAVELRDPR